MLLLLVLLLLLFLLLLLWVLCGWLQLASDSLPTAWALATP
jgi:hypothetical protein